MDMSLFNDMSVYIIEIPAEHIFYVSWTLDSYEGFCLTRTLNRKKAIIDVICPPDFADDVLSVLESLKCDEGVPLKILTLEKELMI